MVDTLTGTVFLQRNDFSLFGPLDLEWTRGYRSNAALPGPLGFNWVFALGHYLEAAADGFFFIDEDGARYLLPFLNDVNACIVHQGAHLVASRVSHERYEIRLKSNRILLFEWPELAARANLIEVRDLNGWKTSLTYDHKRRLSTITDSAGRILLTDCDSEGRITAVRLRNGQAIDETLVRYEYDDRGDLVAVTDAAGFAERYVYDTQHRLLMNVSKLGTAFVNEYDAAGRCVHNRSDCGFFEVRLEHHPLSKSVALTKPNGATEVLRYNEANLMVQHIDPYGASTSYSYNRLGKLESELDPNGNASRITYDDRGNVAERTELDGTKWAWKHDELGLKTEETNPSGAKRTWKYDERGNLLEETDPEGRVTCHSYDARGLRTITVSPDRAVQRFRYSRQGLLSAVLSDAGVPLVELSYDNRGNVLARKSAGGIARFRYDAMCRRVETMLPDGSRLRRSFDAEGNILSNEESPGQVWFYAYEKCNLRVSETDPTGQTTRISYNKSGNVAAVVDPGGTQSEYGYDSNSRVTQLSRCGRLRESYGIDPAGNFVHKTDAHGDHLLSQEIAPLNRPVTRRGLNIESRFEYDQANRIVRSERETFSNRIKYDELDRVTELEWNNESLKRAFAHDNKFAKLEWSEGLKCEFSFPESGPSSVILDPCGGTHRVFSRIESLQTRYLPNGISEVKVFDSEGGLTQLVLRTPTDGIDEPSFFLSQKFDELGRVSERSYQHCDRTLRLQHDALDRITLVASSDGVRKSIRYDAGGNALPSDGAGVEPGNRLVTAGDLTYRYNERGNVIERRQNGSSASFSFNSWDELTEARASDGETLRFHYDGLNKRCAKNSKGAVTLYHWHEHLLFREIRPDASRRIFVHESADDVVPFMFVDLSLDSTGKCVATKPYYVHADGNGIPVAVSNEQGEIVWTLRVNPFGEFLVDDPHGLAFHLRYPGQYFDSEIGLCYNGYRIFDPQTHRFLQSDPLGLAAGLNLYQFPGNPLQVRDLLGECGDGKPTKTGANDANTPKEGEFAPRKSQERYPVSEMASTKDADRPLMQNPTNKPVAARQAEAQDLANRLHNAQSDERKGQTVAVGVMEDGTLVVTTKGSQLNSEQRDIIANSPNTKVLKDSSGAHAEQQLVNLNEQQGGVSGIAVSRPPCSNCAPATHGSGVPTSHQPTATRQKVYME